ncbi:hypothetical protein [Nonomuraea sp. NPDC002799]
MARAKEILPLNIEDLDFAGRRALVKAKDAQSKARRRGQARALLDEHTALHGAGTGWDLHEFRHSGLTHVGAAARDRVGRPVHPDHPDRPETTEPWS